MSSKQQKERIIGIISDTHGMMRPEAIDALKSVELILHAGDIGSPDVLEALRHIAPVIAVRGNNDNGEWARDLPESEVVHVGPISIYMLHDLKTIDIDPVAAGFRVVVSGHSHKPSIEHRSGVLYLNPGSAGRRRFTLPISLARLKVTRETVSAELVDLVLKPA